MIPPTSIDGTDITGATIDGTDVQEITVDGQTVFSATPFTIIDDFNDNDFSEYDNNAGLKQITTNPVEGSGSVSYQGARKDFSASFPGDGLPQYFSKGEVFSFVFKDSSGRVNFNFGAESPSRDGYHIRGVFSTAGLRFEENKASFNNLLDFTATNYVNLDWYEVLVEWHDGSGSEPNNTFKISIFEVDTSKDLSKELGRLSLIETKSTVDSTYNGSGLGPGSSDNLNDDDNVDIVRHFGNVQ